MKQRSNGQRGGAMLELTLFAPWIFFIFAGALDLGYYTYALISVENAARVASLYTSTSTSTVSDGTTACTYAMGELKSLPNVRSLSNCDSSTLRVTAQAQNGSDGSAASLVSVTYQSLPLIPIPGLLQGQFTWRRSVIMRLRG